MAEPGGYFTGDRVRNTTMWSYMKPLWLFILLAPLLMLVEVWVDLKLPQLMTVIIDEGISNGDIALIMREGFRMIAYALIGVAGGIGCFYFSTVASEGFAADLRAGMFGRVQSFSFHNLDHFRTGSLVTRMTNDIMQVKHALAMALRTMVRAPFMALGGLYYAVRLSPRLSLVFIPAVSLLALGASLFIRIGFPYFQMLRKKLDRVNVIMQENLAGARVVRAFVREEYENRRFNAASLDFRNVAIRIMRIMSLANPLFSLVMYGTVIAVLWMGGIEIVAGGLTTGELMAFVQYISRIMMSLMMVSFFLVMLVSAKAAKERIDEVLSERVDILDPDRPESADGWPQVTQGRVEFRGVTFRYDEGEGDPVLHDVSFVAEPGQTVAILGATGSGKSTLVHLIPRLYEVTQGQVLVDGVDVRSYRLHDLRGAMGISLQQPLLLSRSVRDNIAYGDPGASGEAVREAARDAQAEEFICDMEKGYDSEIAQRGVNLSGGQKQRLAIARALAKNPKILIFDDSTSAVDVTTEVRIREALLRRAGRATVLLVAQRISSVMAADKILVLDDGSIAAQGAHSELMKTSAIYREIYESQLGGGEAQTHA
jgi:ATP-binding cassette subfamily B multidrug efflux pump